MRSTKVLAAVLAGLALAACTSDTPSEPVEPPKPPVDVQIEFAELSLSLRVPGRFGEGSLRGRTGEECAHEEYSWSRLPSGADDDTELLTIGTTSTPCPDEQALNGRFPTWAITDDLPADAKPVPTPSGEGHRFSFKYTQCTNECNQYDYDVMFVELPDQRSFWIQTSGVDPQTVDEMVASVKPG